MKTALSISELSHTYGEDITLKNLSFSVGEGEFFIIIGPNGSGKTTLMKIIAGIEKYKNGRVSIFDKPDHRYFRKELARVMAYVPQVFPVDFPFTVKEVVMMGRAPHMGMLGFEQEPDFRIAEAAMAFTGIKGLSERKMDRISGGERQRAIIARALCQDPRIVLLDEPTAALDLSHQIRIMDLMEQLKGEKKATIVMVSHDVNLAALYADTLLILKDGEAVGMGTPARVLTFENLEKAYGCTLLVDQSPLGGLPRVSPVPQKFIRASMAIHKSKTSGSH
ncbi:MAG: ABC transporter ATP-binding protein [Deltaproteobacteria bacterium]|nr:ABC transporter ATP-binding protein [Deltaproteobacteria bacterium]MBW2041065.1 ABC transporter ATP-binding protein [Deltaproteobacteria bacterium]MBW2133325.1 ABC transporter ATP-binding protein [Deltaproteobacteria bacterium]